MNDRLPRAGESPDPQDRVRRPAGVPPCIPLADPGSGSAHWLRDALAAVPDPPATARDQQRLRELALTLDSDRDATEPLMEGIFALFGRLHYHGDHGPALSTARAAVTCARRLGNAQHLRRALSLHGMALLYADDLASAAATLAEALAVAQSIGDSACAAPVWNNLGLVFQQLGQYEAARNCFEIALSLSSARYPIDDFARSNLAFCDLHVGKFQRAAEVAEKLLVSRAGGGGEAQLAALAGARHVLVRALLALGQVERAREHAPREGSLGASEPQSLPVLFDGLTTGMLEVYGDDPNQGITRLREIVRLTEGLRLAQYPEALAALVQALEAVDRSDEALVFVHSMLARTRARLSDHVRALLPLEATECLEAEYSNALTSQAVSLHLAIGRRIGDLLNLSVTGAEQSGHDRLHVFRKGRLAELFALDLGWEPTRAAGLGLAVTTMDVGMFVVPSVVRDKRRGLSDAERRVVNEHITASADFLSTMRLGMLESCIPVARFHHERFDGRGPLGLVGEAIPLEARIATLADAYEALTHDRPWRAALTAAAALRSLGEGAGRQFDPQLAPRFVAFVKALYWQHDRLDEYLAESAVRYELSYLQTRDEIDRLRMAKVVP